MGFINAQEGRVNFQVFEHKTLEQRQPSDPSFEFVVGRECDKFVKVGLTHEVIGPDPSDGGPMLYCVCPSGQTAKQIKAALELMARL